VRNILNLLELLKFMCVYGVSDQRGTLMGKRVLVTGGAGFIGSHLVNSLVREGFEVVVLDNFFSGRLENLSHIDKHDFCLIRGDVRNKSDLRKALRNVAFVFHLAAIVNVPFSIENPLLVNEVNVDGTLNVLEESLKSGVERLVYASSCAVYGDPLRVPIDESHPTMPLSPYGVSKLVAEHYCRVFYEVYGLETVCLRLFNVYGSRQGSGPYAGVISRFINLLRGGKSPVIFGDGNQTRDFVYVEDVVNACLLALKSEACIGEFVNVGSGVETSINELAEILIEFFGLSGVEPKHARPRVGDINRSCASLEKARSLLGYSPRFSLESGLGNMLRELAGESDKKIRHK